MKVACNEDTPAGNQKSFSSGLLTLAFLHNIQFRLHLLSVCHFADNPLYIYTVSASCCIGLFGLLTFRASLSGNVEVIEHLINEVNDFYEQCFCSGPN